METTEIYIVLPSEENFILQRVRNKTIEEIRQYVEYYYSSENGEYKEEFDDFIGFPPFEMAVEFDRKSSVKIKNKVRFISSDYKGLTKAISEKFENSDNNFIHLEIKTD